MSRILGAVRGRRPGTTTPGSPCLRAGVLEGPEGAEADPRLYPRGPLRVPLGFRGDSRHLTKRALGRSPMPGPPGRTTGRVAGTQRLPFPRPRTPPEGLRQCGGGRFCPARPSCRPPPPGARGLRWEPLRRRQRGKGERVARGERRPRRRRGLPRGVAGSGWGPRDRCLPTRASLSAEPCH